MTIWLNFVGGAFVGATWAIKKVKLSCGDFEPDAPPLIDPVGTAMADIDVTVDVFPGDLVTDLSKFAEQVVDMGPGEGRDTLLDQMVLTFYGIPSGPNLSADFVTEVQHELTSHIGSEEQQVHLELFHAAIEARHRDLSLGENFPPLANAGRDIHSRAGAMVFLDGSRTVDEEGDEISYSWEFLQTPHKSWARLRDANSPEPYFKADRPGKYVAMLTAADQDGDDFDLVHITIGNGNEVPPDEFPQEPGTRNVVNLPTP